jgi:DNA polymerase III subunit epsilon
MSWLQSLVEGLLSRTREPAVPLGVTQRARVAALRESERGRGLRRDDAKADGVLEASVCAANWVVADVETSGLNPLSDRLLAIGAVGVSAGAVVPADSFEVVLKQAEVSSAQNVLVHRISGEQQMDGVDPVDALLAFHEFVANRPLLGYHAGFDQTVIRRASTAWLGFAPSIEWVDLALLLPKPQRPSASGGPGAPMASTAPSALDVWLAHHKIEVHPRHHASADAFATAQLMSVVLQSTPQRVRVRDWQRATRESRWLG